MLLSPITTLPGNKTNSTRLKMKTQFSVTKISLDSNTVATDPLPLHKKQTNKTKTAKTNKQKTTKKQNRKSVVWFCLGFFFCLFLQELNLKIIK